MLSRADLADSSGWLAQLDLAFAPRAGRTRLVHRRHVGPLAVQRPFYPDGPVCHVYLLHPPGGVVGGDQIGIRVECSSGSHVLLTTPAAGKFYRSDGREARQTVHLHVGADAALEWLPQENIAFDGALARVQTTIELSAGSRFIGWEAACLGRPAAGESFDHGLLDLRFHCSADGRPLLIERLRLDQAALRAASGLRGHSLVGSLYAYPGTPGLVELLREQVGDGDRWGVTLVDGLLVCRALADRAGELRRLFARIWTLLRPAILDRAAVAPRIWAT